MKTRILNTALTLFGTAVLFTACQKEPVVSFTSDKTEAETSELIQFTDATTEGSTYSWTFGDGQTSTDKSPSHSWSTAGIYTVELTVSSENGKKSDSEFMIVTINEINKKFIGTYTVSENMASDLCGSGAYNYTMTFIAGSNGNEVTISNLGDGLNNITGIISGSTISIQPENKVLADTAYWDLCDSTPCAGTLNGNVLTLSYSVSDTDYLNDCGNVSATLSATKQ